MGNVKKKNRENNRKTPSAPSTMRYALLSVAELDWDMPGIPQET